ncbi:MAG: pilus assembly protein PilM [Candidatus Campbellbacteria bacterium]|nr:pilus assembly protein PilM [Candidatus Campbellbacteria bacterium]
MTFTSRVLSLFPTPAYLSMLAAGIDVSDNSVKYITFSKSRTHGRRLSGYGSMQIPKGVVVGGKVVDAKKLTEVLSLFREKYKLHFVRASLPEEEGYIFPSYVPTGITKKEVQEVLEFKLAENVPLTASEAVFDFDSVRDASLFVGQRLVSVSAYPQAIAQQYADLLIASGLEPLSLEIEAQAIARAIVPKSFVGACMVVDVGRTRSGISVVRGQAVRFTATVDIGGDNVSDVILATLPATTEEDMVRIKNQEGLHFSGDATIRQGFETFAKSIATELDRYIVYWQTHKDIKDSNVSHIPIERVFLSGGNANIAGLPEYLAHALHIPVEIGNVWTNAFSLDGYVPEIPFNDSLGYASAIGLALHEHE